MPSVAAVHAAPAEATSAFMFGNPVDIFIASPAEIPMLPLTQVWNPSVPVLYERPNSASGFSFASKAAVSGSPVHKAR